MHHYVTHVKYPATAFAALPPSSLRALSSAHKGAQRAKPKAGGSEVLGSEGRGARVAGAAVGPRSEPAEREGGGEPLGGFPRLFQEGCRLVEDAPEGGQVHGAGEREGVSERKGFPGIACVVFAFGPGAALPTFPHAEIPAFTASFSRRSLVFLRSVYC